MFMVISCGSAPAPVSEEQPVINENGQIIITEEAEETAETGFSIENISQEYYVSTMDDVRVFIEELNKIISSKNYRAWVAALSPEYFAEISSKENLQRMSESPAMVMQKITLRTAEDYFNHVVVPSRANSRLDDIEFLSLNRVKAYTINLNRAGEEQRLRLYDLEKTDDVWKIIN